MNAYWQAKLLKYGARYGIPYAAKKAKQLSAWWARKWKKGRA